METEEKSQNLLYTLSKKGQMDLYTIRMIVINYISIAFFYKEVKIDVLNYQFIVI